MITSAPPRRTPRRRAFSRRELLIAAALLAVLGAIAIPGFEEARVRARISRLADAMRLAEKAINAYVADLNEFPPPFGVAVDGRTTWLALTTPVSYMNAAKAEDPFIDPGVDAGQTTMVYHLANVLGQVIEAHPTPPHSVAPDAASPVWWWLASRGPDGRFGLQDGAVDPEASLRQKFHEADDNRAGWLSVIYDPTNGLSSLGNLYRAGGSVRGYAGMTMQ